MRELRPAQRDICNHIIDSVTGFGAAGVWAGMGLGKTGSTYTALDALHHWWKPVYPALVIGPLRVAKNTWPDEITKWPLNTKVVSVTGTASERMAALATKADVYTINYENVPWLCSLLEGVWPFKTVVIDESTKVAGLRVTIQTSVGGKPCEPFVKGQGTKRSKELLEKIWRHDNYVIELTGTPATRGLEKLWGQLFFMDYGQRLGRTFTAFENRWFGYVKEADGYTKRWPLAHADKQIHAAVIDICRSFDAKDYYDIKDPITTKVWVDLPPKARKHYKEMEQKFFTEILGNEIEAFNAGAKSMKLSQLANGAAYIDGSTERWVTVHDEKLDALDSIIEEACGMPVMVVYWFKSDLARLKERYPEGRVLDSKKETEDAWNRGEIPILFTHYESAGHGINLQDGGNICAIFGMTWSLELYMQVIERIGPMRQMQSGHDRAVFIYQILARNTIDEEMCERQATHRNTLELLMEAARRRG